MLHCRLGQQSILWPKSLADDFTGTKDVIKHAITSLRDLGFLFRDACCLYATSPFTTVRI